MCIHKHPYNMLIKTPEKIQGVKLKTHLGIVFKRKSHDPVSNKHSHREVCLFFSSSAVQGLGGHCSYVPRGAATSLLAAELGTVYMMTVFLVCKLQEL